LLLQKNREIMFPYGVEETLHKKMETEQNAWEQSRKKPIVMQAKDAVGSSVVESFSLKSANGAVSTTRACGFMTT